MEKYELCRSGLDGRRYDDWSERARLRFSLKVISEFLGQHTEKLDPLRGGLFIGWLGVVAERE